MAARPTTPVQMSTLPPPGQQTTPYSQSSGGTSTGAVPTNTPSSGNVVPPSPTSLPPLPGLSTRWKASSPVAKTIYTILALAVAVVGLVGLRPAFQSVILGRTANGQSQRANALAGWSALLAFEQDCEKRVDTSMPMSPNCTHAIATVIPPPPGPDSHFIFLRDNRAPRGLRSPDPETTKETSPVLLLRLVLFGLGGLTLCITARSSRAWPDPKALYNRASWPVLRSSKYGLPHYLSAELRERFSDVQDHRLEVLQTHGTRMPRSRHLHYGSLPNAQPQIRTRPSNVDRLLEVPQEKRDPNLRRRLLQFGSVSTRVNHSSTDGVGASPSQSQGNGGRTPRYPEVQSGPATTLVEDTPFDFDSYVSELYRSKKVRDLISADTARLLRNIDKKVVALNC